MSGSLYIDHFGFALGEEAWSVEASAARGRLLSDPAALRAAGFDTHRVCAPQTTAYELARTAVRGISDRLGEVDAIVYATCIPRHANIGSEAAFAESRDVKHLMDFPACHLQADFGLRRALVMGLDQQACAGTLGAVRLARALLSAEPELERVLCVAADRFPEGALYEQAYNLMSDGATACVVSRQASGFRLLACHGATNGALARISDDEAAGSFFGFSHRIIVETLARAALSIDELAWIVPQNMNRRAWEILSRLLRFDPQRVLFPSLAEIGHLVCGDNFINLKRLEEDSRFRAGERVLLFMAGYGLNWQCAVVERS